MPKLVITLDTGEVIEENLQEAKITVGRADDNMIIVKDGSISAHHAELIAEGKFYRVYDLGSTNGTRVDGQPANGDVLKHGTQIILGYVMAVYSTEEGIAAEKKKKVEEEKKAEEMKKTRKIVLELPPETETAQAEIAQISAKPVDFETMSPFKESKKKTDKVGLSALAIASIGVIACLIVVILIIIFIK